MIAWLSADSAGEEERWIGAWARTGRQPFAHPDYVRLFVQDGERALCVIDERTGVLLPLIQRPLGQLLGSAENLVDLASPYGYGGPFGGCARTRLDFLRKFALSLGESSVVSAFIRASVDSDLVPGFVSQNLAVVSDSDNVRVDLMRSHDQVWREYDPKVRKNVNKARRMGCWVEPTGSSRPSEFLPIYYATMSRRGAASRYWFDESFFDSLERSAVDIRYYVVRDVDGRAVSVEAILYSEKTCYSFLGGTLEDAFPMAPNDLLKHRVICDALEGPQEWFVLGGGVSKDDGIFRYKRAFFRAGVVPFCTVRAIGCQDEFASLLGQSEGGFDRQTELRSGFFPSYRA